MQRHANTDGDVGGAPPSTARERVPQWFAAALLPLTTVCRPGLTEEQVQGYYAALGDLGPDVLMAAASKIAASRVYPTYPTPGEIRREATDIVAGHSAAPSFGEAWSIALCASRRLSTVTDPAYRIIRNGRVMSPEEFNAAIFQAMPPIVAKTLRLFGMNSLTEDEICRSQFRKMYEETVERERSRRMLPAVLVARIEAIGNQERQKPSAEFDLAAIASKIGKEPAASRLDVPLLRPRTESVN